MRWCTALRKGSRTPTDGTWSGGMLTVYHRISDSHTTGYTIERVQVAGPQRYRIDLRGRPPFIQFRARARELGKKNRHYVYASTHNAKGACYGIFQYRRIFFPRTRFATGIKSILWARKSGTDLIETAEPLTADVRVGDSFVVHSIQPGDEVVIPSHFAARADGVRKDAPKLNIYTTGSAGLRLPDRYRAVSLVSGGRTIPLGPKKAGEGVKIDRNDLRDGRAVVNLELR